MIKKRASKDDEWKGMIGERVDNLVKTTEDLKGAVEKGFEKADKKFVDLTECINSKFDKHNLHHTHQDKKYLKYLFILAALVVGSLISNPNGLKVVWGLIKIVKGAF